MLMLPLDLGWMDGCVVGKFSSSPAGGRRPCSQQEVDGGKLCHQSGWYDNRKWLQERCEDGFHQWFWVESSICFVSINVSCCYCLSESFSIHLCGCFVVVIISAVASISVNVTYFLLQESLLRLLF